MTTSSALEQFHAATASANEALLAFEAQLRDIKDADLHRADPDGGWTVAQIISHLHISGILWIANMDRVRHAPELFIFREEIGHDVLGAVPASAKEAADRLASLRQALSSCLADVDPATIEKVVEVPPFGKFTIAQGYPLIIGHVTGHIEQARTILQKRGALPA